MERGFTLVEIIVSTALFGFIVMVLLSFVFWIDASGRQAETDRQTQDGAALAMDVMLSEIRAAQSVYTPTTAATQLSLQTARDLPANETATYVDFFICGNQLCMKRESQDPVELTPSDTKVTALAFTRVQNGSADSVSIALTLADANGNHPAALSSSAALRSY